MDIWHRVTFGHKDNVEASIQSLGIKYRRSPLPGNGFLIHVDIYESSSHWPQIAELVGRANALDVYNTVFTPEEILCAEWVRLMPVFEQGYPQPEKAMAWRENAYENYCIECGAGHRQKASFYLKKEPRLKKNDFLSLFWTYTLFCTSDVLTVLRANQIQGYETWDAIIHQINQPSKIVSQLVFPHVAEAGLADKDKIEPQVCRLCGITKYAYHKRGYMHLKRDSLVVGTDFQLTYEWFGSGGRSGFREILISNRLARLILDQKWRGVSLKPVRLV